MDTKKFEDLKKNISTIRGLMVKVSTGNGNIDDFEEEYNKLYFLIAEDINYFNKHGLTFQNLNSFLSLWDFYSHWSSGELPTYQSRRQYISSLYKPIEDVIFQILVQNKVDTNGEVFHFQNDNNKYIEVTWVPDVFYTKLIDEINHLYTYQLPMSISILNRKLLENLVIEILRKKYGTDELSLYHISERNRFHDFSVLLKNLDSKKEDFHYISPNFNSAFIKKIDKYRGRGNSGAHSIDVNLTMDDLIADKENFNYIVQFLLRVLKNIKP